MGIVRINNEVIILDSKQLKILDDTKDTGGTTAFKIIGPPSSGKTLVAELLLNEYIKKEGNVKKVLYMTKSEELIDNVIDSDLLNVIDSQGQSVTYYLVKRNNVLEQELSSKALQALIKNADGKRCVQSDHAAGHRYITYIAT